MKRYTALKTDNAALPTSIAPTESLNNLATYFSERIFSNELSRGDNYQSIGTCFSDQKAHVWFTPKDARDAVSQLGNNKAPGGDSITAHFLKHGSDKMMSIIALLANLSIIYGHFPTAWRINRAVALLKKGNRSDPANYRIITISSVLSRTIERMIYPRLLLQIGDTFFHRFQSGFRSGCSVTDNLFILTESIKIGMNKKSVKGFPVAFLDISKAFDSVDHKRLVDKCRLAGISDQYCRWISSFLSDRSFYLHQSSVRSSPKPALFGVPQGSIISPLLFLIFINDIADKWWPTNIIILLFADDIALLPDTATPTKLWLPSINRALQSIHHWSLKNLLLFSPSKSAAIFFSSLRESEYQSSLPPPLMLGPIKLRWVNTYKYLGLTYDRQLKWNAHCKDLLK